MLPHTQNTRALGVTPVTHREKKRPRVIERTSPRELRSLGRGAFAPRPRQMRPRVISRACSPHEPSRASLSRSRGIRPSTFHNENKKRPSQTSLRETLLHLRCETRGVSFFSRRKWDLNPCDAINVLLPFQGSPFSLLGISPNTVRYIGHVPNSLTDIGALTQGYAI